MNSSLQKNHRTPRKKKRLSSHEFQKRLQIAQLAVTFLGALGPIVTLLVFFMQGGCKGAPKPVQPTKPANIIIIPESQTLPKHEMVELKPLEIKDAKGELLFSDYLVNPSDFQQEVATVTLNSSAAKEVNLSLTTFDQTGKSYKLTYWGPAFSVAKSDDTATLQLRSNLTMLSNKVDSNGIRKLELSYNQNEQTDPIVANTPSFLGLMALALALIAILNAGVKRLVMAYYTVDETDHLSQTNGSTQAS